MLAAEAVWPAAVDDAGSSVRATMVSASAASPFWPGRGVGMDVVRAIQQAPHEGQKLNWRSSIVDLMKLLDLDSSLQARKQLAQELHYTGDTDDSAAMNVCCTRK